MNVPYSLMPYFYNRTLFYPIIQEAGLHPYILYGMSHTPLMGMHKQLSELIGGTNNESHRPYRIVESWEANEMFY
ncbi:hypothetical protein ACFSCX_18000 [Bacillus salitolerans]|uniref:Uncharacterized protein n=1 Tax=Bacillus salitolerans TaxID=1437434 RepID=A0ABW4LTC1_9BACI